MPINIKELRIGNAIQNLEGETYSVIGIGYDEYGYPRITTDEFETISQDATQVQPVLITNEKLLELGFKKEEFWEDYILEKEVFFQDDDCFGLIKCLEGFKFCVDSETGFNTINEKSYNYLHEIQNLYFDLKNTE